MYALAWAGIAHTYASRLFNSDTLPSDVASEARAAAERAVSAGDTSAEAHTALATVRFLFDWDWPSAETHLRRAIALNPSVVQSHWMLGHVLSQQGHHDRAIAAASRALELDPLDALSRTMASQIAFSAGIFDAAASHAHQARVAEPEFWVAAWQLGQAYEQLGRIDDALNLLEDATRLSNGNSKPMSLSAYVLAAAGRGHDARRVLTALERRSRERYVPHVALALAYLGVNDEQRALDALERAEAVRDVHLMYVALDPKWHRLRRHDRFGDLLGRCGFRS
jgi:tetratricopeptide (TPR) repeat protein